MTRAHIRSEADRHVEYGTAVEEAMTAAVRDSVQYQKAGKISRAGSGAKEEASLSVADSKADTQTLQSFGRLSSKSSPALIGASAAVSRSPSAGSTGGYKEPPPGVFPPSEPPPAHLGERNELSNKLT